MALLPEQVFAICSVTGPSLRGTGFLIDESGLALTAAHLLKKKNGDIDAQAPVAIRFIGPPELKTQAKLVPDQFQLEDDWALLKCDEVPAGVQAFKLRTVPRGAVVQWESFGFPDGHEWQGSAIDGVIQGVLPKVELRSNQQTGTPGGFSGGPLFVNQQVAGILIESRDPNSPEKLYALRIDLVADKCAAVRAKLPPRRLPHVRDVSQILAGLSDLLVEPARALGVPNPDAVEEKMLRLLLAEAMLAGGVPASLATLMRLASEVDENPSSLALRLAAHTWVPDEAAEALDKGVRSQAGQVAFLLDAHESEIATWYTHRASCATGDPAPGLYRRGTISDKRPSSAALKQDVVETLARILRVPLADVAARYRAHNHRLNPIVLVVPPPVPSAAALASVFADYPEVRFLLMGTGVEPQTALAARLQPPLDPVVEKTVLDELARAQSDLAAHRAATSERE